MGRALGSQYTLGEPLGSGAMGKVYEGADHDGRPFAFKLLRSDLVDDPEFIARFHQERSMLVNIRGEHLVAVHDLVVEGSTAAIVMDLVPGGTLRDLLVGSGTILPAEVARIGAGIADALHKVHLAGIVHRDVKPENVLMDSSTPTRTPKLTDFGISKMTGGSKVGKSTLLAGTPNYVAPEIANGGQITPAADLYSLGIVLYELCCGVTPFASDSVFQVLRSHGEMMPGRPEGVPDELWDAIWALLQKNPAARPRSADQVAAVLGTLSERLRQWPVGTRLDTPPPAVPLGQGNNNETVLRMPVNVPAPGGKRKRRLPVVLAAVVLLGAVGGIGYFLAPTKTPRAETGSTSAPTVGGGDTGVKTTQPTSAKVTTTVADIKLTSMPDLVGKKLGEARDKLPKDMKVEIVDQVDESKPDGTVVGQEPAAGEAVDGSAKLVVARPAITVFLDQVKPSAGRWGTSDNAFTIGMAGKQYLHALGSTTDSYCTTEPESAEYNLSKGYRRFVAVAGIGDNAQYDSVKVQLEVFGDGRLLTSSAIEFGKVVDLDLDLTNVLRLKFQWVVTSGPRTCGSNVFALGEAKLLGLAGEVPTSGLPPSATTSTKPATTTTR
ncbi:protein kinase [Umezawaea sp. NPDC059074]|uniref:protein kinase domain-containing protein n=1 Tax=Umezawaea sp. NPDC059074 TaxID=3346716 RepID=UPI0036BB538C